MIKQVAAKNTIWHDVFRLKYAQKRPENSFWCPTAFQLKFFAKPIGKNDAKMPKSNQNDVIYLFPESFKFCTQFKLQILGIFQPEQIMSSGIFGLHSLNHHHITQD